MRATGHANSINGRSSHLLVESQHAFREPASLSGLKSICLLILPGLTGWEAKQQDYYPWREDKMSRKASKGSFGISEKGMKGQSSVPVTLTGGQGQESWLHIAFLSWVCSVAGGRFFHFLSPCLHTNKWWLMILISFVGIFWCLISNTFEKHKGTWKHHMLLILLFVH